MRQWLFLLFLLMMAACRPGADDLDLVRRADALWQTDMDSAAALLARVERPELLPRRELLHYGWLTASMDASLHKGFLDDRLTLQLQATDLFNSTQAPLTLYSGNRLMTVDQESRRRIRFTLRYKFNAAKSKYKGTGAGQEQRSRM